MSQHTASDLGNAIKATTENFLNAYLVASKNNDPSAFSLTLAPDCQRFVGPPSFLVSQGAPSDIAFSNEDYEKLSAKDMEFWSITSCHISYLTIDTPQRKSAAFTVYSGQFNDGTPISRNLAWFLDFNDDGSKIVKIYQLNDSEEAKNFRVKAASLVPKAST